MKRPCYISKSYRSTDGSGNKAKTDNEKTMELYGATNLGVAQSVHKNKVAAYFINLYSIVKYACSVRRDDVILVQYPLKKYYTAVCRAAHWRGAKTVTLIHDLGSFRRKKLTVRQEIARLMQSDYVIASNSVMQQWLVQQGYTHPTGALGLFDYRSASTSSPRTAPTGTYRLVYAGGLAMRKNAFFLQLAQQQLPYELHIYGNRSGLPTLADNKRLVFHPFMPADEFISSVEGDFGLVWDGDTTSSCTGNFGEYLRYNSPHKVSFYLRAGLPIIIWRQAAVAPIIEREGVGLCIDSLDELPSLLASVTTAQWQQMCRNVTALSDRLSRGCFLKEAFEKAQETLSK